MAPVGNVPAASPATYIEIGTVASETSGASDAPTIEPVAKMTAEFAPVSACAAAKRRTLDRARASSEISSATVTSIIGHFHPHDGQCRRVLIDSAYYEGPYRLDQPMQTGARYSSLLGRLDAPEHQREIIGGHLDALDQHQAGPRCQPFQGLDIAHTPFGISFAQACVEHGIADGCVLAVALEWAVQKQLFVRPQVTAGAGK